MKRLGAWPVLGGLLAVALALGLATGGDAPTSRVPSVKNAGPHGLKVLATWLFERGLDVRSGTEPLSELSPEIATLVVPPPTASRVTPDDVEAVRSALARGATVVLLVDRASAHAWAPLVSLRAGQTETGELSVAWRVGPLRDVERLLVGAPSLAITVTDDDAVALTKPEGLWLKRVGRGALYVIGSADLAENGRLDKADNARFWLNLASQGPIWFDESHHIARAGPPPAVNLWATGLQFAFAALVFVLARATRLGPPRAEGPPPLRSATEYVEAMARLTQRAAKEDQLVESLRQQVRLLLHERLGISLALPDAERARALSLPGFDAEDAAALFSDTGFLSLSRRLARLEDALSGRKAGL